MSKDSQDSRDLKKLRQNDKDLVVRYNQLLLLREELARLLCRLNSLPVRSNSSPRTQRLTRKDRSAARAVKRNVRGKAK
jgi:hypothetical protein